MHKLKLILIILVAQALLISCSTSPKSGTGFLIGKVRSETFGDPIFPVVSPLRTSVTYLDRDSGIAFVSADQYQITDAIEIISSGPTKLPQTATQEDKYLGKSYQFALCLQRGDCSKLALCNYDFKLRGKNVDYVYSTMQSRGFPIAQFKYISESNDLHNVTISYFTDCEKMTSDARQLFMEKEQPQLQR